MLKVVVVDSGSGGEFFADRLEEVLPIIEVIRVIDWRNAEKFLNNAKAARKLAREDLRPYIGKVDLIIFANHLLSITSLKFFRRKYKNQRFLGLNLKRPDTFVQRDTLILTTKAVTKTITYYNFLFQLKRNSKTMTLDSWPVKIDDGELSLTEIEQALQDALSSKKLAPKEVVLACSQFNDIKTELRTVLGRNIKIYDSFDDAIKKTCKVLNLRGGTGKKT